MWTVMEVRNVCGCNSVCLHLCKRCRDMWGLSTECWEYNRILIYMVTELAIFQQVIYFKIIILRIFWLVLALYWMFTWCAATNFLIFLAINLFFKLLSHELISAKFKQVASYTGGAESKKVCTDFSPFPIRNQNKNIVCVAV